MSLTAIWIYQMHVQVHAGFKTQQHNRPRAFCHFNTLRGLLELGLYLHTELSFEHKRWLPRSCRAYLHTVKPMCSVKLDELEPTTWQLGHPDVCRHAQGLKSVASMNMYT